MDILTGAIVSLLVGWLKKRYATNEWATLGFLAVVSLAAAGAYTWLKDSNYWPTVYTVITTASAFYALIIQRFSPQSPEAQGGLVPPDYPLA